MPKIKLISETIPSGNSVLLTHHQHSLARELTMQLTSLGNFKIENFHPGSSGPFSRPDVIIHLAGLGSPSLNETLSCTTELYDLLQIASRYSSRFILILPDSISHLKSTAHTLFLQFSQSHRLRSHIIEVNPDSDRTAVAQQIIRHFKYGYAYQSPVPITPFSLALSVVCSVRSLGDSISGHTDPIPVGLGFYRLRTKTPASRTDIPGIDLHRPRNRCLSGNTRSDSLSARFNVYVLSSQLSSP